MFLFLFKNIICILLFYFFRFKSLDSHPKSANSIDYFLLLSIFLLPNDYCDFLK